MAVKEHRQVNFIVSPTIPDATEDNQPISLGQVNLLAKKYKCVVGDGTTTSFTITHNLNSQDISVVIRENGDDFEVIYPSNYMDQPKIKVSTVNTITVYFFYPPTNNQYKVIISA